MHTSPDHVLAARQESWLISGLLALFAFGIPIDNMIAGRIGSSSVALGAPLGAMACWQMLVTNRLRPLPAPLLLMIGFVAWGAASVLWARDQNLLLLRMLTNAQLLLFLLLSWQVLDSERTLSMTLAGFVAGCICLVADVWRAYLAGEPMGGLVYEGETRYVAEGFDPNDMGVTLALGIPMAAYLALSGGWRARYVVLAYLPLAASGIVLSASRGATVTALVAALGVLLWFGKRKRHAFALVLALLAAGLAISWQLITSDTWARIFTLRDEARGMGTAGYRTQIWRAGLSVFARHPIAGVGAGGFSTSVVPVLGARFAAHSTLLSVAVDLGLVGLVLYLGAFAAALRGMLRRAGDQEIFGLALLASWLVGTAALSWDHRKTTWLVLLLCSALGAMRTPSQHGEPT